MDAIDLDSDCEIQEQERTIISIADSEDDPPLEEVEKPAANELESEPKFEIEEGEVFADEPDATEPSERPIFKITFEQKDDFKKVGANILTALELALNADGSVSRNERYKFNITTDPATDDIVCINGMLITLNATTDDELPPPPPPLSLAVKVPENAGKEQVEDCNVSNASSSPDFSKDLCALFTIDTAPATKLDTVQVPSYKRAIRDVLDEETAQRKKQKTDDVDKCQRPRQSAACFNCGSNEHSIRDCPKPRNMKRINRAKKAFSTKQERYHVDIEQRFAHLRPGAISEKLQSALGLRRGELPFFFYRMRVLGYPPGWLEEAKVAHSGIALFNSDGSEVLKPDECEGEVDNMDHKYDISKIVEFPGYNLDPGPNFYDDYQHQNVPPMNEHDMKAEFIKTLGDNILKGYKRKKLKDLPTAADANDSESTTLEITDMDIEDPDMSTECNVIFTRPLPPLEPPSDEVAPPPPPPPPPLVEEISLPSTNTTNSASPSSEERSQSPTLADLEEQQLKLLNELQSNTSNISVPGGPGDDSLIDEVLALEENTQTTQSSVEESTPKEKSTCAANDEKATPNLDSDTPLTPTTPVQTKCAADVIKESHMGTPLLKFSPFDKLPAGDNFKVGVSDVINFENLPDSTGKYEQMKKVIKKVRNIVTKLHNDDDDN